MPQLSRKDSSERMIDELLSLRPKESQHVFQVRQECSAELHCVVRQSHTQIICGRTFQCILFCDVLLMMRKAGILIVATFCDSCSVDDEEEEEEEEGEYLLKSCYSKLAGFV